MTFGKLIFLGAMSWLLLAALKFLCFGIFNIDTVAAKIIFFLFTVLLATAMSRRLGVINFLEAATVSILWFIFILALDFMVLGPILNLQLMFKWEIWAGYGLMILSIFFFHRKRHIQVRREQAAAHGHH